MKKITMSLNSLFVLIYLLAASLPTLSQTNITTLQTPPASLAPEVYFVNISEGDKVRSPFRVVFGLTRIGIAPANVDIPSTGHHHLLINTPLPGDLTKPIPFSDNYRHFGGGQSEAVLTLPPGKHSLQLVFADAKHRPYIKTSSGENIVVFSRRINIEVLK
jgi:hypothetical protein